MRDFAGIVLGEASFEVIGLAGVMLLREREGLQGIYVMIVFILTSPPSPRLRRAAFAGQSASEGWRRGSESVSSPSIYRHFSGINI